MDYKELEQSAFFCDHFCFLLITIHFHSDNVNMPYLQRYSLTDTNYNIELSYQLFNKDKDMSRINRRNTFLSRNFRPIVF